MLLNELPELENIIDKLEFTNFPPIFDDGNCIDFLETAFELMDYYLKNNPTVISEPDFYEEFYEDVCDFLLIQFEDQFLFDDSIEDEFLLVLDDIFTIYIDTFVVDRSNFETTAENNNNITTEQIENQINYLRSVPQPVQRTKEWYEKRHTLITASNAYKAFEKGSGLNQLIYEKCKPIIVEEKTSVSINSPLHWGQKYEPLSVMIYENMYNTQVEDFGCIPHSKFSFLGASPDGIVINKESDRYGRMLEIKNIVNREITGIPKKEYWIQMQLQMEVCDLDYCDFLETKFVEYEDYQSYFNDGVDNKTINNELKGVILYFNTSDMKPLYIYKPLDIIKQDKIDEWIEHTMDCFSQQKKSWIKTIYWKVDKLSCVLVKRNKDWFCNNVKKLEDVWNIITHERVHGYEHRSPKKKAKTENIPQVNKSSCFLNVIKIETEKLLHNS
jgi:putative phage-type endonuclease